MKTKERNVIKHFMYMYVCIYIYALMSDIARENISRINNS